MPAFTFEKISPPSSRGARRPSAQQSQSAQSPKQQTRQPRPTVIQVLGRFVEARVHEGERPADAPPPRPLPK